MLTSQSTKISGRRGRRGRHLRTTGTPPVCSDARIVRRTSTVWCLRRPRALVALGGQAALELRHHAVHGGQVLDRPAGKRAVELVQRPRRRQPLGPLDGVALELAAQVGLEAAQGSRGSSSASPRATACGSRVRASPLRSPRARRMRCTSTPRTPEPSPWRPKAAMASRARSRSAASLPSRMACGDAAGAAASRSICAPPASSSASCSEMSCSSASASGARKKKRSKTRSKMRRSSEDLASVAASASLTSGALRPADLAQRRERVEQLRGPDGHALGAQLLGQLEQPRGQPGRRRVSPCLRSGWHPPGRRAARPPARRRCRGRCGA